MTRCAPRWPRLLPGPTPKWRAGHSTSIESGCVDTVGRAILDGMPHDAVPDSEGETEPYELVFPNWYTADVERECAEAGFFNGPTIIFGALQASLTVYDAAMLAKDVEVQLRRDGVPCAYANLLVLPQITRAAIIQAVSALYAWGEFEDLAFEGRPKPPGRH